MNQRQIEILEIFTDAAKYAYDIPRKQKVRLPAPVKLRLVKPVKPKLKFKTIRPIPYRLTLKAYL